MERRVYFAHSANKGEKWHPLASHLESVAKLASGFASVFCCEKEGETAGLLHDIGKYGDLFQKRLEGRERGINHWSAGAKVALDRYKLNGVGVALAVHAHHLGLTGMTKDALEDIHRLGAPGTAARMDGRRLSSSDHKTLLDRLDSDSINPPGQLTSIRNDWTTCPTVAGMLDVRMLFSALVDADYLDTEAHFSSGADGVKRIRANDATLEAEKALDLLTNHLDQLSGNGASKSTLSLRKDLLDACTNQAEAKPGLFTLSAPTGAGKTLAMLAFALKHAKTNGLRRIIVVIPYLSIIEQTASIYRSIFSGSFPDEYVLEDHSMSENGVQEENESEPSSDDQNEFAARRRALAENWDAPIIVTTSVKFLESLFTNKPGRARKLHRIAQSVILFDEVQTLPSKLAIPTLAALSHLASSRYGCSAVFATATQPAFEHLNDEVGKLSGSGWKPKEIAGPSLELFKRTRRVRVQWLPKDQPLPWDDVSQQLEAYPRSLCIVNLRKHAYELANKLAMDKRDDVFHLSTYMCPAHREAVLNMVRGRLKDGYPVRLVSTQCVEAGVDLDFPVVYRAFGPLEAITQAAGRCNRNGLLDSGTVVIFYPEGGGYPPGYKQAVDVTEAILKELANEGSEIDITSPELFERYYKRMYNIAGVHENNDIENALTAKSFVAMAKEYKIIDNATVNALVPYDPEVFRALRDEAESTGLNAKWIRKARKHAINIYRNEVDSRFVPISVMGGERRDEENGWYILGDKTRYDPQFGLLAATGASFG